jgi:hypothetical protein
MRQKEELRRQILALLDDLDKAIPENNNATAPNTATHHNLTASTIGVNMTAVNSTIDGNNTTLSTNDNSSVAVDASDTNTTSTVAADASNTNTTSTVASDATNTSTTLSSANATNNTAGESLNGATNGTEVTTISGTTLSNGNSTGEFCSKLKFVKKGKCKNFAQIVLITHALIRLLLTYFFNLFFYTHRFSRIM